MKKHTIKSLLALLVVLCLLLGSVAALAEENNEITPTIDDDGNYTADVGKVEGRNGTGIAVQPDSDMPVEADGKTIYPQPSAPVESITINAESVTEKVEGYEAKGIAETDSDSDVDITVKVEGNVTAEASCTTAAEADSSVYAQGIEASNSKGTGTVEAGDVNATAKNVPTSDGAYGDATSHGIDASSSNTGETHVSVGNVTATANGDGYWDYATAYGIIGTASGEGKNDSDGNPVFATTIKAKDVEAIAYAGGEDGDEEIKAEATGIFTNQYDSGHETEIKTGNASIDANSVSATAVASGDDSKAYATAIDAASKEGTTAVTVKGNVTATAGDAEKGVFAVETKATGVKATAYSGGTSEVTVGGSVTATANGDQHTDATAISVGREEEFGGLNSVVPAGNAPSDGEVLQIEGGSGNDAENTVHIKVTGNVVATAQGKGNSATSKVVTATGIDMAAKNGTYDATLNGDVSATAKGEQGTAVGISADAYHDGVANITVNGDVSATGIETKNDESFSYAAGIAVSKGIDGQASIAVLGDGDKKDGDVTATGPNSIGVAVNAAMQYAVIDAGLHAVDGLNATETQQETDKPAVDVFVNGTVSGGLSAIVFVGTQKDDGSFDLGDATVTTWAAKTNGKTDSVAAIMDSTLLYGEEMPDVASSLITDSANDKAKTALAKAIFYIAKVGESGTGKLTVTGKSTRAAFEEGGKDYQLAHENETVTVKLTKSENEELDGIYYNDSAENEADKGLMTLANGLLVDNGDGSYSVTMKRGGAMLLGLKTHCNHSKTVVKQENVSAPSCTKNGSHNEVEYCAYCGEKLGSKTVTDKATGHTAGAAVKEHEVAAKVGEAGSYDEVVYCTLCHAELNRTKKTIPALPEPESDPDPDPDPDSDPDPNKPKTQKKVGNKRYVLVYETVPGDEFVRGLKGNDKADALQVFKTLADSLGGSNGSQDGQGGDGSTAVPVIVTILGMEKVLTPEELTAYNQLPLEERLALALAIASDRTTLREAAKEQALSDDAKALADTVATRFEGMKADELAKLDAVIAQEFPLTTGEGSDQGSTSVPLRLKIAQGDKVDYEQYTFTNTNGEWKLSSIAKGVWKLVED